MRRHVLVVGGTGGLGQAVVRCLADARVAVSVAGRRASAAPGVQASRVVDATAVDWDALYQDLEPPGAPPLDGIVFVAGAAVYGRTALVPEERARRVLELNFWACASAATAAARRWTARGIPGAFVAVLSLVARRAVPFEAHYAASKAAAARFLECLELEHAPAGLRFAPVYPGTLRTGFRGDAEWFGITPSDTDAGTDAREAARAIVAVLEGRRRSRVIGWRERTIDLADRIAPELYDRAVLRRRVQRTLG
jgi:short-subunit dehydrogenase